MWHDLNGDGRFDVGEPELNGLTVQLRDGDGIVLQTTTTDANGNYLFDQDLLANTEYVVTIALSQLPNFQPTPSNGLPPTPVLPTYDAGSGDVTLRFTTGDYGTDDLTIDFPFVEQFNVSVVVGCACAVADRSHTHRWATTCGWTPTTTACRRPAKWRSSVSTWCCWKAAPPRWHA